MSGNFAQFTTSSRPTMDTQSNVQTAAKSSGADVPHTAYRKDVHRLVLTPQQRRALRTGRTIPIMVGRTDHITPVDHAYLNVLRQYSGLARKPLPNIPNPALVLPKAAPHSVWWSYKFMLNGETDVRAEPMDSLDIGRLAMIYSTCQTLEYPYLASRAFNRIKFLLVTDFCREGWPISTVWNYVPDLREKLVNSVAFVMTDDVPVMDNSFLETNELREKVGNAVQKRLVYLKQQINRQHRGHSSHSSQSSGNKSSGSSATQQSDVPSWVKCYGCGGHGHVRNNCPASIHEPLTCYNCGREGHFARSCDAPQRNNHQQGQRRGKYHRRTDDLAQVTFNGERITTCIQEVKPGMVTRTGLRI